VRRESRIDDVFGVGISPPQRNRLSNGKPSSFATLNLLRLLRG
jgi:hypothetical protein